MKLTPLIILSLALNGVGAALVLLGRHSSPAPARSDVPTQPVATATAAVTSLWPSLETTELPSLVERLRAAGFPTHVIRAIIRAQISERFASRQKALDVDADRPFWRNALPDPKIAIAKHQLSREQRQLERTLLGELEDDADPVRALQAARSLDFLPIEKIGGVRRVFRDFEERRSELYATGYNHAVDREKITALEKEQQAALAQLLTPDEFQEYQIRNSETARTLRDQLSAFEPTEEEFRVLFKLRQPFDERFGKFTMTLTANERLQRTEAETALKQQVSAALGPQRGADYERSTDHNFRRASQLVKRLELPAENATALWTLRKDFEQRRNETYRTGDGQDRAARLAELHAEALTRVTPLLGGNPQLIEVYQQNGGNWLETLTPRPRPTPKQ